MKTLKDRLIKESNNRFHPEDYTNCETDDDVVNALIDALSWSGVFDSLAESVSISLDPHIFTDNEFLKKFGEELSNAINEIYEEEYA